MLSINLRWLAKSRRGRIVLGLLLLLILFSACMVAAFVQDLLDGRSLQFLNWWRSSEIERLDLITIQQDTCPGAPFSLPAEGYIGLLYSDPRGPYSISDPHQGIDIFSNSDGGITPVYAAYDGYITREENWRSTLIQRVPEDPLAPGRQIWLYYTHMADQEGSDFIIEEIPPGTKELFVEQGTLLGYTGDYNGSSLRGVWVHLHFSIVKDDGLGSYTNELDINNTLDPSDYLGLGLNYQTDEIVEEGQPCADEKP